MPPGLDNVDILELLTEVIASVSGMSVKDKVFERIALAIASKAAIPWGRTLNDEEMKTLITDWQNLKNTKYTPSGKLIANVLTIDQVSKMF